MSDLSKKITEMQARGARHGPDGFARSPEAEERLNALCRTLFTSPAGQEVMEYLRSITVNAVMPPNASDAELRDREGMRRLVGILDQRMKSAPSKGGK